MTTYDCSAHCGAIVSVDGNACQVCVDRFNKECDIGVYAKHQPAAFWAALTPGQVVELLKCAPKVAGPWKITRTGESSKDSDDPPPPLAYERAGCRHVVYAFRDYRDRRGWFSSIDDSHHDTAEQAMAATDESLRAAGWILEE